MDVRSHPHRGDGEAIWDEHDERDRLMESGRHEVHNDQYIDDQDSRGSFEFVKDRPDGSNQNEGTRPQTLMRNASARRSVVDISGQSNGSAHVSGDRDEGDGEQNDLERHSAFGGEASAKRSRPRGLQAKSGIILVRRSRY